MNPRPIAIATLTGAALALFGSMARSAAPAGRYTIASGTVYDNLTKLTWQQASGSGYTWGSSTSSGTAQSYCAGLGLNGHKWRLPTMRELYTIIDYSVAAPAPTIDATAFPNTPASQFWSAIQDQRAEGSLAGVVDFSTGLPSWVNETSALPVRCVF